MVAKQTRKLKQMNKRAFTPIFSANIVLFYLKM